MGRWRDAWAALRGRAYPKSPSSPSPSGRRSGPGRRTYEAARLGPADGWFASGSDPNTELATSLPNLRATSRKLYRDNAYARRIVDALTNAIVGTGIRPTVDTGDESIDAKVYDLWDRWGKQPVSGSKVTIYGLQQMLVRAWLLDGEALLRLRPRFVSDMPGLPPLKLQPIEADLLPIDKSEAVPNSLNRIYSGVEYDALGEVAAYHLLREHPGASYPFGSGAFSLYDTVRVPADSVVHLFAPLRPGQVRGEPILAPVALALYDLDGYMEAIRVGTRAAATLVATVSGGDQENPPNGVANEEDAEGNVATDQYGNPVEGLAPGTVIYAPDGKVVAIHAPQPPQGIDQYVAAQLHQIGAGAGLSYHILSGDMSDSSFAQAKLSLLSQAQGVLVRREQTFLPVAMGPIWRAFIDANVAAGLLPNDERLYAVRWSQPKQQSADGLQDTKEHVLRCQAGNESLTEWIESEGRDAEEVFAQMARDKKLRDKYGIVSICDLSQVTTSGAAQAASAAILNEPPADKSPNP